MARLTPTGRNPVVEVFRRRNLGSWGFNAVYYAGGVGGGTVGLSSIECLAVPAETMSSLGSSLTTGVYGLSAIPDGNRCGFLAQGSTASADVSTSQKLTFATATLAAQSSTIAFSAKREAAVFQNPSGFPAGADLGAGFATGGVSGGSTQVQTTNRVLFPADTLTAEQLSLTIATATTGAAAVQQFDNAAWICGGVSATGPVAMRYKVTFASDTSSSAATALAAARGYLGAASNDRVAGYLVGGQWIRGIDRVQFATGTVSALVGLVGFRYGSLAGSSINGVAGYFAGGEHGETSGVGSTATAGITAVFRLDYPTETMEVLGAALSTARARHGAMSDTLWS